MRAFLLLILIPAVGVAAKPQGTQRPVVEQTARGDMLPGVGAVSTTGQHHGYNPIDAPKPKPQHAARNLIVANTLLFASAGAEAYGEAYGSRQCHNELLAHGIPLSNFGHLGGGQLHPWRRDLSITLPLDAGVSLLSFWLHRRHHDTLALLLPVAATSGQMTSAGFKYGVGCF